MTTDERYDGWANDLTRLGSIHDKSTGVGFRRRALLGQAQLSALYQQHPIAARIVDLIVDEAFRTPWRVVGEGIDSKAVDSWCDDLRIDEHLSTALKWSRLYGGAVLALPTSDNRPPSEPLIPGGTVYAPAPFDAYDATPIALDDGFGSANYRRVVSYRLRSLMGSDIEVHHSRVIPFEPVPLPYRDTSASPTLWGPSVLERVFDDLSAWGAAKGHALNAMYVSSLLYLKLQGFREDRSAKGGPERMQRRLADTRQALDMLGLFGLDDEDELGSVSVSSAGVHDLMDRLRDAAAAASDMPREILFNESPAGLSGGDLSGPQQIWHGKVSTFREKVISPALDRILALLFASRGIAAEAWTIEWGALWTPSATSDATNASMWAATDQVYYNMGADPEAILHQRLVEGNRGRLQLDAPEPVVPLDLEPEAAATTVGSDPEADKALNGAQVASLVDIIAKVNLGELTYDQGVGVLEAAFVSLRGRGATVLGPRPLTPPPGPAAPAPVTDEPDPLNGPSDDPIPPDAMSPKEIAEKWRVSTRTITRLMEKHAVRYWGLGAHKRVSLADIAKLARQHEGEAPDDGSAAEE